MKPNISDFKKSISLGFPVIFGFSVPKSNFKDGVVAKTGIMKMPKYLDSIIGGHAVLACGYDDNKKNLASRDICS